MEGVLALDRATPQAPHWSREEYENILTIQENQLLRRAAFVAEENGSVAGFAAVRLVAMTCELESMAVAEDWRRKGVGAMLMETAVGWMRACGATRFELEVRSANAGALRLYTRCGLKVEGRRVGYYRHPTDDALLMGMDL